MAELVFTDASVVIDGTDLSGYVRTARLGVSQEMVEKTAMGASARNMLAGLQEGELQLEFNQDFDASAVDDTIWALLGQSTGVTVVVKPTSGAVGADNPSFTATMVLENYEPLTGGVGDMLAVPVTLQNAGSGGWARATS